jgi:hypothetical protein
MPGADGRSMACGSGRGGGTAVSVDHEADRTSHVQMVRRYIRDGSLFRENSAGKLGL